MMLLNETVSDLFIYVILSGLCKTVQNVYILLILKGQKKNLCLSVYMSEITHPIHMQAYLLEELQRLCSAPTRSVPI